MTTPNTSNLTLSGKPKPWLSTDPKPWHNKENATTNDQHPNIIEFQVFESKRPASIIKREKDKGEEDHVVFSCVGADIVVPESIARISGLVCSILDSSGDYIEKQTRTIKFDHISATVLEEVIRFCSQECKENPSFLQSLPQSSPKALADGQAPDFSGKDEKVLRTSFVFELKPELVMELMAAAEYLQIPSLVSHIINMLAEYADDIPSFVGMSESLVEQVCNKCKPATLRKIEIDAKLEPYEKDFTTPLWEHFCGEYGDFVMLNQKECRAKERTHRKYITINKNNNNTTDESNEDVDWRRGYAELTLEKMMSKPLEKQTEGELQTFGPIFGNLVVYLRLFQAIFDPILLSAACPNIQFLEIVGHVGLHECQISSLVTRLPNLRYLRISNAGASPKFWMDFLTNIEEAANLLELDISSNEIGQNVASFVASLLKKNRTIKILNVANNEIQIEGFMEIAAAGINLQVLDASDCAIVTSQKSEAAFHVAPVLGHQLKVLKLSGNNLVKLSGSLWKYLFSGANTIERLELGRVMWVMKDKDIRVLIRSVAEFPHLEYLDLSDNHIEELGMEAICFNLLLSRAPLKTLILAGNTVKDPIAAGLARALRYNSSLQTLILSTVSEYGLIELDGAISENASSAIQNIVVDTKNPQVVLSRPHLFTLGNPSDPTKTYQMRWNPQPR